MKRLFIVRHAKSSWKDPELDDFDRPLNKRGKRDLPDMADRFAISAYLPDLLISSSAKRALVTAKAYAKALGIQENDIVRDKSHYLASSNELIDLIQHFDNEADCIMMFGHNPGLTDLINDLSDFQLDNLPTCGICGIAFNISSWTDVRKGKGKKFYYDFPKSRNEY